MSFKRSLNKVLHTNTDDVTVVAVVVVVISFMVAIYFKLYIRFNHFTYGYSIPCLVIILFASMKREVSVGYPLPTPWLYVRAANIIDSSDITYEKCFSWKNIASITEKWYRVRFILRRNH